MKNLDVDLYITQFRGFFEKNPNELMTLIGDVLVEDFFKRVEVPRGKVDAKRRAEFYLDPGPNQ